MIELIAGGARSGKSSYALGRAAALNLDMDLEKVFVATATCADGEDDGSMAKRIARHQAERGADWRLIEEPLDLAGVIDAANASQVLVIDCLTLWVSNWLCGDHPARWSEAKARMLAVLGETESSVLLVTNEVGMGVVPMGALSREFVDQSGWLHQDIAAIADRVTLLHFGIPTTIKSTP